ILTEGNYKSLHWSDDGTEVVIESPNAVAEEVLAHHFDTNKFLSFTRQLHLYGFRRITDGRKVRQLKGFCKWRHPNFKCGHPHLLDKMYR
ncbi:winged helix DNA-binding domain-containing protein, partial [Martensiomyces pterosporus]